MAILRSLLLRHRATAASLLRCRPLSVASIPASSSVVSPQKPPTPSPPWKTIQVLRFGSASPAAESPKAEELRPCDPDIDEIEGCDFNHWLIVVDFPKDPRPSPEEMVRFYEETCAKALNLSLDEAKKKIYATSTSNYTGFHVQVTEKESEKFQGQPGVVFVLPDSYADKENKEYGGDKYINGIIIPRPRNTKGKRVWDEPRQDQRRWNQHEQQTQDGPVQQQRVYPPYTHQGLTQAMVNNNGPPPSHPPPTQQSYGPAVGHGTDPRYHPFQQNYYGERRPQPNYPFQQPFGLPIMFPRRNPYQQGNVSWVPHQSNYNQVPPLPQVVVLLLLPNGTLSQVASFDGYRGQGIPWVYSPGPSFGAFGPGHPGHIQFPGFSQVDQRNHMPPDWYRASYEQGPCWSQANLQGQPYSTAVGQGYPGPAQGLGFSQVDQRNYVPPDWYRTAYEQGLRWSQANMQGQPHSPAVGQGYTAPPFQGQAYPGHPNQSQGQGYPGHPSHGQGHAYPGHPGQDQGQAYSGLPSQVQGQAYSGQPIQGQGQAHPGQPNQCQGYPGQHSQEQGQGYPGQPSQGQGYAPPSEHQNNGQQGTPAGQQTDNGHHGQGPPTGHLRGPNS